MLLIVFGSFVAAMPAHADEPDHLDGRADTAFCVRCHGMSTLAARDPEHGRLVSYFVDPALLGRSVHGRLSCVACHQGEGFREFPHTADARATRPGAVAPVPLAAPVLPAASPDDSTAAVSACGGCHNGESSMTQRYRFRRIETQMSKGVHRNLRCYDCHDPHQWVLERTMDVQAVVRQNNAMCVQCHADAATQGHRWLPQRDLHWGQVRCIDCHTPRPGSVIHAVQPADRAERQCEACHTRDSVLLGKLYRYRMNEVTQKAGFVNSVVLNDAYVIGMTRNEILDRGSIAAVLLALLGVMLHGAGRWVAGLRRKSHDA
jgi:predicted CXXCH cytochrome family protein